MRFTVTIDEDVAAGINSEMKHTEETFKQVVNRLMRLGFNVPHPPARKQLKARSVNPQLRRKKS